jgi:hypothetical protein
MADQHEEVTVDERRKSNRIDACEMGLRAIDSLDGEPLGIIGNLSVGGMMLITNRQLFADGILQLKIEVPTGLGRAPIPMGVKILWCTPANSPDEYWAGLETIDISPADEDALQLLIAELADLA